MLLIKYITLTVLKLDKDLKLDLKIILLRTSIGLVYLLFGLLKFFDTLSPAESLAKETLSTICFGIVPDPICYLLLASMETLIGLMLIFGIMISKVIRATFLHILGTFIPLILEPQLFFSVDPFGVSLIGQYIVKNIIIISALFVICPLQQISIKEKTKD